MTDKEFLDWLADRLVYVYDESPNVNFVHKLKNIAKNIDANQCTPPNLCEDNN